MSHADYILAILASVGGIFGLALLFAVWRKPGRPVFLVLGWALVAASLVVWFVVNFDLGLGLGQCGLDRGDHSAGAARNQRPASACPKSRGT